MMKLVSAFAALVVFSVGAQAQSLSQQMARCVGVSGTLQRLACYDAAAHDAGLNAPRTASAAPQAYVPPAFVPPAPQAAPAYAPRPPGPTRQTAADFGAERVEDNPAAPTRVSRIAAEVTNFHADPFGRFTVTLSNGQVWKQVEGDTTAVASYRKNTHSAVVARSFLGSYALKFNDSEKMYKVTRVQ